MVSQEHDLNELIEEPAEVAEPAENDNQNNNVFDLPNSNFNLPLRITTFGSSKDFELFIKNAEKLVRSSLEYKLWVKYIIENLGHTSCCFTNESLTECPMEIHHHPVTLYTIVKSVVNKCLQQNMEFSTFDIATKAIELHFQNNVGYVMLISSLHSKYHDGFLDIPIEFVNGKYSYIIQNFTIEEAEYEKILRLCNVHVEDIKQLWHKDDYPGIREKYLERSTANKLSA